MPLLRRNLPAVLKTRRAVTTLACAALLAPLSQAPARAQPAAATLIVPAGSAQGTPAPAADAYRKVDLAAWVPGLRSPGRIILQPSGVSFVATFDAGPRPQKAEYLDTALKLMRVSAPPVVRQAVRLRYGPQEGQTLVAYIEEGAAKRLASDLRPGDRRQFFAFHVYNYAKGPALVITSFGPAP